MCPSFPLTSVFFFFWKRVHKGKHYKSTNTTRVQSYKLKRQKKGKEENWQNNTKTSGHRQRLERCFFFALSITRANSSLSLVLRVAISFGQWTFAPLHSGTEPHRFLGISNFFATKIKYIYAEYTHKYMLYWANISSMLNIQLTAHEATCSHLPSIRLLEACSTQVRVRSTAFSLSSPFHFTLNKQIDIFP
jgi:hypothetical protein